MFFFARKYGKIGTQGEKNMELWDIYDANGKKTGRTMVRGSAFNEGEYHMVIHVCIFNAKGEMLIQQRQSFKEGWPNLWDVTVGGSALAGESSHQAAEREVLEELGLTINLKGIRPVYTINFAHGFDDIYVLEQEIDLETLKLQEEEVQAVKWASKEEVMGMLEEGRFIPYVPEFLQWVFASRKIDGFLQG